MSGATDIDAVVFAGGGSRCLWQAGFWSVAAPELALTAGRVQQVAAVSAGSAIASMLLADVLDRGLEGFKAMTAKNARNAYPGNVLRRRPVFPHAAMYRRILLDCIDAAALGRLKAGPALRVLLARPPRWAGPRAAVLLGFGAYTLEKRLRNPVHPAFGRRVGFVPEVVDARSATDPAELADLILQSSCTPPFTPVFQRGRRPVLDGGLVDNVPVAALDGTPRHTLVLLTRRYPTLPDHPGRTYVQPSEPIGIDKWDYTNPGGLQDAYDLGRRDAEAFLSR